MQGATAISGEETKHLERQAGFLLGQVQGWLYVELCKKCCVDEMDQEEESQGNKQGSPNKVLEEWWDTERQA